MILTPYEKREFASATYLYWEAKAESVDIGRIKFAKKTKKMDLEDPDATGTVISKIAVLKNLASHERAQNLLFTEKGRIVGSWDLTYNRGRFSVKFPDSYGGEWYRPLVMLGNAIGRFARSREDFIFADGTSISVYENNTLMTREDMQSFIRKVNNSAAFIDRINTVRQAAGTTFYEANKLVIPNLVESNYNLEAVQTSAMEFVSWDGRSILRIPGKTLTLPTGARDLSRIVPRRI
jgi:hypothetical protein